MVDNSTTITLSKDAKKKLEAVREEIGEDCSWTSFAYLIHDRYRNMDRMAKEAVRRAENGGSE